MSHAIGRQTLTVDNTKRALTVPAGALSCDLTLETASIRMNVEGTDPVAATTGHLLEVGDSATIRGRRDMERAEFIREGAVSGVLQVTYYS